MNLCVYQSFSVMDPLKSRDLEFCTSKTCIPCSWYSRLMKTFIKVLAAVSLRVKNCSPPHSFEWWSVLTTARTRLFSDMNAVALLYLRIVTLKDETVFTGGTFQSCTVSECYKQLCCFLVSISFLKTRSVPRTGLPASYFMSPTTLRGHWTLCVARVHLTRGWFASSWLISPDCIKTPSRLVSSCDTSQGIWHLIIDKLKLFRPLGAFSHTNKGLHSVLFFVLLVLAAAHVCSDASSVFSSSAAQSVVLVSVLVLVVVHPKWRAFFIHLSEYILFILQSFLGFRLELDWPPFTLTSTLSTFVVLLRHPTSLLAAERKTGFADLRSLVRWGNSKHKLAVKCWVNNQCCRFSGYSQEKVALKVLQVTNNDSYGTLLSCLLPESAFLLTLYVK